MKKLLPFCLACLSIWAQTPAPIAELTVDPYQYVGAHPSDFVEVGDTTYCLANLGALKSLVRITGGDPATAVEVRYEGRFIEANTLHAQAGVLFAVTYDKLTIVENPATVQQLPLRVTWVGADAAGAPLVLDDQGLLHRYTHGNGLQEIAQLGTSLTTISAPILFGNRLFYLTYEDGAAVMLHALASDGGIQTIKQLGTPSAWFSLSSTLVVIAQTGSEFFFSLNQDQLTQVWRSDGTANGTKLIFSQSQEASAILNMVAWREGVAFIAEAEAKLYRYRNGGLETKTAGELVAPLTRLTAVGQNLLFVDANGLYSMGNSGRPQRLASLSDLGGTHAPLPVIGAKAHLLAGDALWTSDGSRGGTRAQTFTGYQFEGDVHAHANALWMAGNRAGFPAELLTLQPGQKLQHHELNPFISTWQGLKLYGLSTALCYLDFANQRLIAVTQEGSQVIDTEVASIAEQTETALYYLKARPTGSELWRTDGTPAGAERLLVTEGTPSFQQMYPSGEVVYYTTYQRPQTALLRLLPNGEGLPLTGYVSNASTRIFPDNRGGIYVTNYLMGVRSLWHASAEDNALTLIYQAELTESSTYPMFKLIGNRLWMRTGPYENDFNHPVNLISSDGTAAGTFSFITAAQQATMPIDLGGQVALMVTTEEGSGLAISDGSAPFDPAADWVLTLGPTAALFAGHQGDLLYGIEEDDENRLWRYDLVQDEAVYLATLPSGIRPLQRIDRGTTTLLSFSQYGRSQFWVTDGSETGTALIAEFAAETKPGLDLTDAFYFVAADHDRYQRLYEWQPDLGVQRLPQTAGLNQPEFLTLVGDQLYFTADDQYQYGLYHLGDTIVAPPPINLSAKRLGSRGGIMIIEAEAIPGATYAWQLEQATAIGPIHGPTLRVHVWPNEAARVAVTVTYANGEVRTGELALPILRPSKVLATQPIVSRRGR